MGVPRLFQWILETFPESNQRFRPGTFSKNIDYLYIDGNALVHPAAQLIYRYGKYSSVFYDDDQDQLSDTDKMISTFQTFFNEIVSITSITVPKKVLFISLDGPAPLSKQAQQRERRFTSALTRDPSSFDQNAITPGTTFSYELNKFMEYAIREELKTNKKWKNLQVIFSPTSEPGEGEHKLLDYIRSLSKSEREKKSHCLVGPDGDLIMLALAAHTPNIFLLREDQFVQGLGERYFYLIDIGDIRNIMGKIMFQTLAQNEEGNSRTINDISNDFILLGFLVGNDFLPKIKMFYMLEQGVKLMIEQYESLLINTKSYLTSKNKVNIKSLAKFIEKLTMFEQDYLVDQYYQYKNRVRKAWNQDRRIELKEMEDHTLFKFLSGNPLTLDYRGYRKAYYERAGIKSEHQIEKMCFDYVKTLIWILDYYVSGLKSWTWSYDWHYPPLMSDLYDFLKNKNHTGLSTFNKGEPSFQFEQLISVLPPSSSELLPKPYARLLTEPSSPLVKKGYYPLKFQIDYEGKTVKYQGVVLLPFIKNEDIIKAYNTVTTQIEKIKNGKTRFIRNQRGFTCYFSISSKCEKYIYLSQLTNITREIDSCISAKKL